MFMKGLPSGNQTQQRKTENPPFVDDFPIKISICIGISHYLSDYQRVVDLNDGPNIQTQLIPTPAWTSVPTPFSH